MGKMKIDYTYGNLRLDDMNYARDYSIRIRNFYDVQTDKRRFAIVVNLHDNEVVVVEFYDKVERVGGIETATLEQKRIYHRDDIFNAEDVYVALNGVQFQREPLKKRIDYLYYNFNDEWGYKNLTNGDELDPAQVSGHVLEDTIKSVIPEGYKSKTHRTGKYGEIQG